ncbi:hypothetical protein SRHO_G00302910 [Serrasalmus rhombeus]
MLVHRECPDFFTQLYLLHTVRGPCLYLDQVNDQKLHVTSASDSNSLYVSEGECLADPSVVAVKITAQPTVKAAPLGRLKEDQVMNMDGVPEQVLRAGGGHCWC